MKKIKTAVLPTLCLQTLLMGSLTFPKSTFGQEVDDTGKKTHASLNLKTLYHPLEKINFAQEQILTHWIGSNPSQLIIRRDKVWNEFDLQTGQETPWSIPILLSKKLQKLQGVTETVARSAVDSAVVKLKNSDDTLLVRINRGLAVASLSQKTRWISKEVTGWRDITLSKSGSTIAYTKQNNLFVIDVHSGKHLQLTQDGSETTFNGHLDWTYQEEIYGRGNFKGFWLSPNGKWLATLKIDTSEVPVYSLGSASSERGVGLSSRYPKAGDPIPHASLMLWDLRKLASGRLPRPHVLSRSSSETERLTTGVWWNSHDGSLVFAVSNRIQSWRELHRVQPRLDRRDPNFHFIAYREDSEAWIEPPAKPSFLQNGEMLWLSEIPSGYSQVYLVPLKRIGKSQTITMPHAVTPDQIHVRDFWVSPDESSLAYLADHQNGTVEQHLYKLQLTTKQGTNSPEQDTKISHSKLESTKAGSGAAKQLTDQAGWNQPQLSPDWNWLLNQHNSAVSPNHFILTKMDSKESREIGKTLLLLDHPMHQPEFFSIPNGQGVNLPAAIIRPDASTNERLPVVIEIYGGPGSPVVTNRWRGTRNLYRELLAQRGIATFMVDNRSSAGRGLRDAWSIQGRVGEVELEDLRTAITWLKNQNWVDPDRLLIRGWSFGGFMTISAMTSMNDFKAGIAGGSVTDWAEYDAFYTERYMGLPQNNEDGYQRTSPIHRAENLEGSILLIHGEADDNVHPTGTLRMAKAFQQAGKPFRLMIYPDEAHAIRQANNVWHLSQLTDQFINEQLLE